MASPLMLVGLACAAAALSLALRIGRQDHRDTEGFETCSIEDCGAILRGWCYRWDRGLRSQRVCDRCAEEMLALTPSLRGSFTLEKVRP